jgi:hypothetical protein
MVLATKGNVSRRANLLRTYLYPTLGAGRSSPRPSQKVKASQAQARFPRSQPDLDFVSARAKQRRGRHSISQHQADPESKAKRAPAVFLLTHPGGYFTTLLPGVP